MAIQLSRAILDMLSWNYDEKQDQELMLIHIFLSMNEQAHGLQQKHRMEKFSVISIS